MNPEVLPQPNALSVLCPCFQGLIIQRTAVKILLYSAIKAGPAVSKTCTFIPWVENLSNTHMCLHITFKNLAVPEKLSNTSIQQPIKRFDIGCYACRRRAFPYNGLKKHIMYTASIFFLCSTWRRNTIEPGKIALT